MAWKQRPKGPFISPSGSVRLVPVAPHGEEHRVVDLVVIGAERDEELQDLVHHLVDAGVGAVHLVDDDDGEEACCRALRSTKRVCGMGPSAASTSSRQPSAMDRTRSTSPPKSAWPGVSMMLIFVSPFQVDGGVLGEDRDPALSLQVVGVQDAAPGPPGSRGRGPPAEHLVHQRGLAVVDVGNDGDVAEVHGVFHPESGHESGRA